MKPPDEPTSRWDQLSATLREAGVARRPPGEDLSAPYGFATRVTARLHADARATATGLALWRRWSLTGAACALLLAGGSTLLKPDPAPTAQLIPVPLLDELPNFPAP
jgi:hypothetical protein